MRPPGRLAISLLGCFALLIGGCAEPPLVRDLGTRAVVIGIDGADWKVIDRLATEGVMPNLTRLRERGVSGPIATLPDIALSPVIWTSVATGKTADQHGVAWFMVDRADGTRVPVRSYNRKCKAIWNILADHGRRPASIGWWATYPAEDVGDGTIVSDGLGYHGFGSTARDEDDTRKTWPASAHAEASSLMPSEGEIESEFALRFLRMSPERYAAERHDPSGADARDPGNPIHLFQQYAVTAQGYTSIAERMLARNAWDLLLVYFEQVDSFSHLFMKYAPPKLEWVEADEFERYRDVVDEWYRYQDELLGRLLQQIDLDTTAVFVLSDHGFKSAERRIRSERTVDIRKAHLDHETHGIFLAAGPHIRSAATLDSASVLDLTPTLLHYLGFPVARDMRGRVLADVFDESFRAEHVVRFVETYEGDGAPPVPAAPIERDMDPSEVAERMEALRALGYVGGAVDSTTDDARVAEGDESSPEIHNNLGRVHLGRGRIEDARREFERALKLDPDNADALLNLAAIQRVEGRIGEAEHLVKRALRVNPNSIAALAQLAEIKRDQGELDESVRLYREALAIDDSQPFVHLGLGDSLQRAGQYDLAMRAFESVLQLDPDSFEAHYNLGVTHLQQQQLDEAAARFETALELSPRHPAAAFAYNNLGDVHMRRGDTGLARDSFARATDAAPGHVESHYNLGALNLAEGKIDEAIVFLEKAVALAPDHEAVHSNLGMAYLRKGNNEGAYKSFVLVRRLYPNNWVGPLGLALLHAGSGQRDEARRLLEESLRVGGDVAREEAQHYPLLRELQAGAP
ncbi:MAG: tetratricopeptide repeat protein [bacterium]|nr:tetratricopeptide repeat protein [bacterium]